MEHSNYHAEDFSDWKKTYFYLLKRFGHQIKAIQWELWYQIQSMSNYN